MQSVIDRGEIYGERKLSELLEFATKDLTPGPGYRLLLEGIAPSPVVHKELEAFFGATLDKERGAAMELGFDEITEQMVMRELAFPLKGLDGAARLLRTESIGYIPLIEIRGAPFKAPSQYMSYAHGQKILEGFGIEEIPGYDPAEYKAWRANVLSKTQGWHLTEQVEVPMAVTADSAQASLLVNQELLAPGSLEVQRIKSFTRSIVLFNDKDGSSDHVDFTLETDNDALRMFKQVYKKLNDPFAMNNEEVTDSRLAVIKLNENSYLDFSNALLEVTHARKIKETTK